MRKKDVVNHSTSRNGGRSVKYGRRLKRNEDVINNGKGDKGNSGKVCEKGRN